MASYYLNRYSGTRALAPSLFSCMPCSGPRLRRWWQAARSTARRPARPQGLRCLRSELPNLWCSELFTGPFNLAGSFAEVVQPANVRIGRWLHVVSVTAYRRPRSEQFVSGGNAAGRPSAVRRGRARGARRDGGRVLQLMAGLPVGTPRPYPVSKAALRPALARR